MIPSIFFLTTIDDLVHLGYRRFIFSISIEAKGSSGLANFLPFPFVLSEEELQVGSHSSRVRKIAR